MLRTAPPPPSSSTSDICSALPALFWEDGFGGRSPPPLSAADQADAASTVEPTVEFASSKARETPAAASEGARLPLGDAVKLPTAETRLETRERHP